MATIWDRYAGVMEPETVKHALKRMRQLGFPKDEWDDLLQELAIVVLTFQFQEHKSNGARRTTAIGTLVNHRLVSFWRSRHSYQQRLKSLTPREEDSAPEVGLAADVQEALATMTPRQRQVCQGLVDDLPLSEMARRLRCDRATVRATVAAIRRRLEHRGVDGWVR